jgi:hypothetical protein
MERLAVRRGGAIGSRSYREPGAYLKVRRSELRLGRRFIDPIDIRPVSSPITSTDDPDRPSFTLRDGCRVRWRSETTRQTPK